MVSERLNGIALMHVHQEIIPEMRVIDLVQVKTGGLISHKSFCFHKFRFLREFLSIIFTFNSLFAGEVFDSLFKICDEVREKAMSFYILYKSEDIEE